MTSSRFWILSSSSNNNERRWRSMRVRGWLLIIESSVPTEKRSSHFFCVLLPNWLLAHFLRKSSNALSLEVNQVPESGLKEASERLKEDISSSKFGWKNHMFSKWNSGGCYALCQYQEWVVCGLSVILVGLLLKRREMHYLNLRKKESGLVLCMREVGDHLTN